MENKDKHVNAEIQISPHELIATSPADAVPRQEADTGYSGLREKACIYKMYINRFYTTVEEDENQFLHSEQGFLSGEWQ